MRLIAVVCLFVLSAPAIAEADKERSLKPDSERSSREGSSIAIQVALGSSRILAWRDRRQDGRQHPQGAGGVPGRQRPPGDRRGRRRNPSEATRGDAWRRPDHLHHHRGRCGRTFPGRDPRGHDGQGGASRAGLHLDPRAARRSGSTPTPTCCAAAIRGRSSSPATPFASPTYSPPPSPAKRPA